MSSKIENEGEQLGPKNDNGVKNLGDCALSWTPGQENNLIGNVFQQSGITKTLSPRPKQESPVINTGYTGS